MDEPEPVIVVEDHGAYVVTVDPEPRCECRSPLTPKGCLNADCWNWRGPNA